MNTFSTNSWRRRHPSAITWLWLGGMVTALLGNNPARSETIDLALGLQSTDFELNVDRQRGNLNLDGVALRYGEVINAPVRLDLLLGRTWGSLKRDAPSTGISLLGYYGGLDFYVTFFERRPINLGAGISYRYHDLDGSGVNRDVSLTFSETAGRLWLALRPVDKWTLYGGTAYVNIDGERLVNGDIDDGADVTEWESNRHFGGARIDLGAAGYLRMELHSGNGSGGAVFFGQRFQM